MSGDISTNGTIISDMEDDVLTAMSDEEALFVEFMSEEFAIAFYSYRRLPSAKRKIALLKAVHAFILSAIIDEIMQNNETL